MPLTISSAGKFCWKLFDSSLWPEKAPVQEKLPLTLNVPGTVRMGPLEKAGMKVWMWAHKCCWKGYCIERDKLRK